jgi:hypothetical protein
MMEKTVPGKGGEAKRSERERKIDDEEIAVVSLFARDRGAVP